MVVAEEVVERTLPEWLRWHVIDGEKEGLGDRLDEAMKTIPPLEIINEHLLDGMKTVGELFGSGRMQLPFVLQSARGDEACGRTPRAPHGSRGRGDPGDRSCLATVKGDVHDIGKNLVDIILTNNGWTVHNIGIKQPISEIIKAWT